MSFGKASCLPAALRPGRLGFTVITGELKSKIDRVWDAFWSGGISNPLEVIEQITYLLFIRRLDDLQTAGGEQGQPHRQADRGPDLPARPGRTCAGRGFKNLEPGVMYKIVGEQVFPFLARQLGGDGSTYSEHMKDARFTIPTPALLSQGRRHARRHPDGRTATPTATCTSTCSARSPPPGRTASSARRATSSS